MNPFNIDRAVFALAGTLTLVSAVLGATVSPWWLLLAGFVGANQLQASLTGLCPAALILSRLGVQHGCAFVPDQEAVRGGQRSAPAATMSSASRSSAS